MKQPKLTKGEVMTNAESQTVSLSCIPNAFARLPEPSKPPQFRSPEPKHIQLLLIITSTNCKQKPDIGYASKDRQNLSPKHSKRLPTSYEVKPIAGACND